MAGRLPALQAGAGRKRRDGEPVPYGRCGRAHVAVNDRRYGRA